MTSWHRHTRSQNDLDPRREEIPAALLERITELGYFGLLIPAEEGGLGLGVFGTAWCPRNSPGPG